ncbi:MAG: nuclease-related domain-containing protein [Caldicoprobacterales bacterium]
MLLAIFTLIPIVAVLLKLLSLYLKYRNSNYKLVSGNSFFKTIFDKGNYGEFLTFTKLEKLSDQNKLLTNLYIPRDDGTTTEVDLVMISPTGIYVFESKNYSGWIFGDEKNKNWTQTLENGQKNRFYNPIWQNKAHINALKTVLNLNDDAFKSYIIFSERCTLKKIKVTSSNVKVIKRDQLIKNVKKDIKDFPEIFTSDEVNKIYSSLQKYTNVDEDIKQAHIEAIKSKGTYSETP